MHLEPAGGASLIMQAPPPQPSSRLRRNLWILQEKIIGAASTKSVLTGQVSSVWGTVKPSYIYVCFYLL